MLRCTGTEKVPSTNNERANRAIRTQETIPASQPRNRFLTGLRKYRTIERANRPMATIRFTGKAHMCKSTICGNIKKKRHRIQRKP